MKKPLAIIKQFAIIHTWVARGDSENRKLDEMNNSTILQDAQNAFIKARFDIDSIINLDEEVTGIVVYRGNNPQNGWWTVKPSHIENHVKLDADDKYMHLSVCDCVKQIKKMNRL